MPRELKTRGRRAEKQRHLVEAEDDRPTKRRKHLSTDPSPNFAVNGDAGDDLITFGQNDVQTSQDDTGATFYGLLTEEETQYYANVNNKIIANDFESDEERHMFIEAVHRESAGKEIKIASSQSCSRYVEKLIRLSSPTQLISLFEAFLKDLNYLVQHRFGSHCCETLFAEASKHVDPESKKNNAEDRSLEHMFIDAVEILKPNIGFLLTERFASHTIRVLLLVLSGRSPENESVKEVIASRKKEQVEVSRPSEQTTAPKLKTPTSFKAALNDLTAAAIAAADATYLRALATHPIGNPTLQLLLQLEMSENESTRPLLQKLVPDQNFEPESESSKFVSSLVYDATGAYLVETLVKYLPGKAFKRMYKNLFRDRIGKLAKNEIASYVAVGIFERVGKDDLAHARDALLPELGGLVERNRLAVIRSLIERCQLRGVELHTIGKAFEDIYGTDTSSVVPQMLKLDIAVTETENNRHHDRLVADLQGSLLAQSMLQTDQLNGTIEESLLKQPSDTLLLMAKNPVASRVIQAALTSSFSSSKFLRQFVPNLYSLIPELAVDSSGSHVVDALWAATSGSHFMKERIGKILQENESSLRESQYGRSVWRNWSMDLFQRRPREWQAEAKGIHRTTEAEKNGLQKSAIELARDRHMQHKAKTSSRAQITAVKATV